MSCFDKYQVIRPGKTHLSVSGADPGFQVRGDALKKIAPSGGMGQKFWGISCEKSRFYAKKSYFFQLLREARKFCGVSCEKSRFYANIFFFSNFRGAPPPPESAPAYSVNLTPTGNAIKTIFTIKD